MSAAAPLWPAPAKLNLFLRVTGRRADGYHSLQTVFQFIELADYLRFHVNADGRITRRPLRHDIAEADDLCVKAAKLLQQHTATGYGAEIELMKHVPLGGGLGGGSSDAATVLLVLNHLWGTGLGLDELAALGARLGADVPVFIHGRACWAEGVGDVFTDIEPPQPVYLIVYPGVGVSTREIFAAAELRRDSPPITIADFLRGNPGNDCEAAVRRRARPVDRAMRWLGRHGTARLTGTGACVFAEMPSLRDAERAAAKAPAAWRCYATRGCNRSPLRQMLQDISSL